MKMPIMAQDTGKINLSKNALEVLRSRYLVRDENLDIKETPFELFQRVAKHVARAELMFGKPSDSDYWEGVFLDMMTSLDFLPNSPTLMNAGTGLGQLSACFVLPVKDTMEDIFESIKQMALVQRTGGGTGFSFSDLRPKSDIISSTSGEASGPVSFMKIFDCATNYIKQGGKRRGANMGILRIDHPDILEFIRAKNDDRSLQNFNLSIAVTDSFMEAVRNNDNYSLIHPVKGTVTGKIKADEVFGEIARAVWRTGDPGLVFIDSVNRDNPTPHLGRIKATNPCGEIPLMDYESCNLGSLNLARMIKNGESRINEEKLLDRVHKAVRFLDNVVSMNNYPVEEIETITLGNRKIGLGVMGFSEMLIRMGISYDSQEAEQIGSYVMSLIQGQAFTTSCELAKARGVYPNWKGSVHEQKGVYIRNATRTAVAPTGTIGIIADTTPSIEPLFALAYRRTNVLEGRDLYEVNHVFREYAERNGLDVDGIIQEMVEKGSSKETANVPGDIKRVFKTALEIPFERHLSIQAAFQRHVENSVSKTVNMPEQATPDEVSRAYLRAWKLGLKGITIYRYGSKSRQVLELGTGEKSYNYDHGSKCDPGECRI